jgi:hypothetical protein
MPLDPHQLFPTLIVAATGEAVELEVGPVHLHIGDGFIDGRGSRYRVVDRWLSIDRHGAMDTAWHVFVEPVEPGSDDDRPGRLHPTYFRS